MFAQVYIKPARIVVLFGDYNNNQQVLFKMNVLEYQDYFTFLHKCFHRKNKSVIISLLVYLQQWVFFICLPNQTPYLVFQLHQLKITLKKACIAFLAISNVMLETNCFLQW